MEVFVDVRAVGVWLNQIANDGGGVIKGGRRDERGEEGREEEVD
jgi:hypothetical protein